MNPIHGNTMPTTKAMVRVLTLIKVASLNLMMSTEGAAIRLGEKGNWHVSDAALDRWLKSSMFIRGEKATITLTLTNNDSRRFVGGKISRLDAHEYGQSFGAQAFSNNLLSAVSITDIPALDPNGSFTFELQYIPTVEGVGWMDVGIATSDGAPVTFGQTKTNEFGIGYQVVSRELVLMLDRIDKLLAK